jgi:hypothetical protein
MESVRNGLGIICDSRRQDDWRVKDSHFDLLKHYCNQLQHFSNIRPRDAIKQTSATAGAAAPQGRAEGGKATAAPNDEGQKK